MMGMSTDHRNRQPKGVSTGGQFAAEARSEASGVALATRSKPEYAKIAEASAANLSNQWEAANHYRDAESATAARGLAAAIRDQFPNADTARMLYDPEAKRYSLASISQADGQERSASNDEALEDFTAEDGVHDFLASINTSEDNEATHAYMDVKLYNGGSRQEAILRLDDALSHSTFETSPAKRGAQVISAYQAIHDNPDEDEKTVAQDMLTDLHRWARANDVDLHSLFDRASWHADEEEKEKAMLEGGNDDD